MIFYSTHAKMTTTFLDGPNLLSPIDLNLPDETDSISGLKYGPQYSDGELQMQVSKSGQSCDPGVYTDYKSQKSCPYPKPAKLEIARRKESSGTKVTLCNPILTSVSTRDRMAIIKIDKEAVSQLRSLDSGYWNTISNYENNLKSLPNFTWAATEPFPLRADPITEIFATFKLFLDGCSDQEKGKYVSIFVELSDPQGNNLKSPFVVTLFLKNLKDENGNSFKKSFKLIPSGSRVERGVKDFVSVEKFNMLLEKESIACFGVLVSN